MGADEWDAQSIKDWFRSGKAEIPTSRQAEFEYAHQNPEAWLLISDTELGMPIMDALQFMLIDFELRHLPGKHNQKDHGVKGVPGKLSAEQYKAIDPRTGSGVVAARKALDATPEGVHLRQTTERWQDDTSQIIAIQKGFMATANGKRTTPTHKDDATSFMHGIKNAPVSPPVFRGARISPDEVAGFKKGKNIILPPSSFTSSQRIAGGFAKQPSRREVVPVIMRVNKGARAIPVELYGKSSYKKEKEWISAGQFTVTNVTKRSDGVHVIDVDHTAMFQW